MSRLAKGVFIIVIALIALVCVLFFYARYGEPARLRVERITLEAPGAADGLRIVALSDLHIGSGGMDARRLAKIADAVTAQAPDAVVFLGDLFENYSRYDAGDEATLRHIMALPGLPRAAKFAVLGNRDLDVRAKPAVMQFWAAAGWTVLVNQRAELGPINLIGSDDVLFGVPQIAEHLEPGAFNLLLVHEPDIAKQLTGVDFQLSGHTHGGQVRLPFLGALVLPKWGQEYIGGLYQKPDGGKVYVSRGLGTSTLPFRFGSVPEITVVDVIEGAS